MDVDSLQTQKFNGTPLPSMDTGTMPKTTVAHGGGERKQRESVIRLRQQISPTRKRNAHRQLVRRTCIPATWKTGRPAAMRKEVIIAAFEYVSDINGQTDRLGRDRG